MNAFWRPAVFTPASALITSTLIHEDELFNRPVVLPALPECSQGEVSLGRSLPCRLTTPPPLPQRSIDRTNRRLDVELVEKPPLQFVEVCRRLAVEVLEELLPQSAAATAPHAATRAATRNSTHIDEPHAERRRPSNLAACRPIEVTTRLEVEAYSAYSGPRDVETSVDRAVTLTGLK